MEGKFESLSRRLDGIENKLAGLAKIEEMLQQLLSPPEFEATHLPRHSVGSYAGARARLIPRPVRQTSGGQALDNELTRKLAAARLRADRMDATGNPQDVVPPTLPRTASVS